ncbi:hypothetical protein [Abditibacterium utsteinense]|uniref:hypothetical protein n=1 Tax=Abditibacterium utsteinense TaxID=1960156 RepID=UPI0013003412|nr:hypothetical protein [Abditibacterium utsteinense]
MTRRAELPSIPRAKSKWKDRARRLRYGGASRFLLLTQLESIAKDSFCDFLTLFWQKFESGLYDLPLS